MAAPRTFRTMTGPLLALTTIGGSAIAPGMASSALNEGLGEAEHVIVLSDSTARVDQTNGPGYGPNDRSDLWPNSLGRLLRESSSMSAGGTGLLGVEGNAAAFDTDRWKITGPFRSQLEIGPYQEAAGKGGQIPANGGTVILGKGGTALLSADTGKTLWIYWAACPDSTSFTVAVDGGAPRRIGERSGVCAAKRTRVFSGEMGSHTASISAPEGNVYLYGAEWTTEQGGLVIDNMAVGGATTMFYNTPAKLAFVRTIPNVKIAIVALGINDFAHQISPETYRANLSTIVQEIHTQAPGASIVILNQYPIFEDGFKNGLGLTQSAYWDVARQIALSGGLTYISLSDTWGSFPSISRRGFLTSDHVHPSDRGGEEIAVEVGRVIMKEKLLKRGE